MPKAGSSAPVGYIYDPDPSQDGGEGRLLAASAAFFTQQGHEVFRDPCPDLKAYRRAGRITPTIVDVNRLPHHILAAGLNLLNSLPPSSAGGKHGMSFMAEYLPASPPAVASQGNHVSLSHPRHGGSGGSTHPFKPTAPSSLSVPSHSARSVGGRSQLDPEPQAHAPIRASLSRSGRLMPSSEYGRLTRARSGLSPSSIPFSVGDGGHHGGFGGRSPSSVSIVVGGLSPHHSNSSTHSEIFNGGGSDSSSPTKGASVASPAPLAVPPLGPIPLPVDRFTLPVIKNDTDYLAACDPSSTGFVAQVSPLPALTQHSSLT